MKYLKRFKEGEKKIEKDLEQMFNLVMYSTEVYTMPYGHYSSFDFNIYIVKGSRYEKDDHQFLTDIYFNRDILKGVYNVDFFYIKLDKNDACLVLYDYILDPNYNKNVSNYLRDITEDKMKKFVPQNVMYFLKSGFSDYNASKYNMKLYSGIDYSDGRSGNLSLFNWKYEK